MNDKQAWYTIALGWIVGAWHAVMTFFGKFWTAAKDAAAVTWSTEPMIIKLGASFLVATALAVGTATLGLISWVLVPASIASDTALLALTMTGVHMVALFINNLFFRQEEPMEPGVESTHRGGKKRHMEVAA